LLINFQKLLAKVTFI